MFEERIAEMNRETEIMQAHYMFLRKGPTRLMKSRIFWESASRPPMR